MSGLVGLAPSGVITLLTDFGLEDPFVGVMKGVMAAQAPNARFVDLTHHIAPQDVRAAAFWLARSVPYFPRGTVHLVVVDPTVGTLRKAIAARAGDQYFVGPDNGVLGLPASPADDVVVAELAVDSASNTFHGRDVFAPAAARLAVGTPLDALGPRLGDWIHLPGHEVEANEAGVRGSVVVVDHYGNLISNVVIPPGVEVQEVHCQGRTLPWGRTYADVAEGCAVALLNSWGYVEVAVRGGSAAVSLDAGSGTPIDVRFASGV